MTFLINKKIIYTLGLFLILFSFSVLNNFALADNHNPLFDRDASTATENVGINYTLKNPLGEINSIEALLTALLSVFIVIATPIIVIAIIYAGFLYVTARGNVEQTKQATTALTYAIIGGVILLGSVAIAEIVKNIVEAFKA